MYHTLDIHKLLNNKGITEKTAMHQGFLAFGGYSLPREQFPLRKKTEVPFCFYLDNDNDNIELEGQGLSVPEGMYKAFYLVGVSNNGDFFDTISFYRNNNFCMNAKVYFPDLTSDQPMKNEKVFYEFPYIHSQFGRVDHYKPKLWLNNIIFEEPTQFNKIVFPDNPSIHIFAMTVEGEG